MSYFGKRMTPPDLGGRFEILGSVMFISKLTSSLFAFQVSRRFQVPLSIEDHAYVTAESKTRLEDDDMGLDDMALRVGTVVPVPYLGTLDLLICLT